LHWILQATGSIFGGACIMAGGVRQDVATLGPGWNETLLNYALAMRALDELLIANRNSWRFLAAMHGFNRPAWIDRGVIKATDTIPVELTNGTYGNQCQHGSWYFLPWHRGYLAAFETIVAAKVKELTGKDWALPYWNYLDSSNPQATKVPQAFLAATLPDGTPNPLRKYPRRPGLSELPVVGEDDFSLNSMAENDFLVGGDGSIGFGGGVTGNFVQFANVTGDLESNPHNTVHGLISGFMGNALFAGLDPLFWLHHCNIDRLWEAWMTTPGKTMIRDRAWLSGPADRKFIMPQLGGGDPGIVFNARDTLRDGKFHPTYDDLTKGTGVTPGVETVARVGMGPPEAQEVEVVGANAAAISVGASAVGTRVDLDRTATASGAVAMGASSPGEVVVRFYLALESVRGSAPSPLLLVYVNLPDGASPGQHPELRAGSLRLFGLNVASDPDGGHGGNGLGYKLDITEIAKHLEASGRFDPDHLSVTLVPGEGISDAAPVTVGRISVLKRSGIVN
jgi:tyrosinase